MNTADLQAVNLQASARRASALLKAMANERRLMILCHLASGEKSVGEIEALVGLSQSALSQHLARLRRDKLVETRRTAQSIRYRLSGGEVEAVLGTLYGLYCAPAAARAKPARGRNAAETRA